MRALRTGLSIALCLSLMSCGGGGAFSPSGPTQPTGSNVVGVIVDQGPTVNGSQIGSVNTLFVTLTVCVPGSTTNCQTIDHIQVDTGSYGLRLVAGAVSSSLAAALPQEKDSSGNSIGECAAFLDGYTWGPVVLADVQMGDETASSLPTHLIGLAGYNGVPADCSSEGPVSEDTVESFGANGIIGIGPFAQDCPECVAQPPISGAYYSCSATTCTNATAALAVQVVNPVTKLAVDNNGTIITLPSAPNSGATTLSGTLTFGVDTQSNNVSGTQTVLNVDDNAELTATFDAVALPFSFIDSGSNGIYFNTDSLSTCAEQDIDEFYCPTNPVLGLAVIYQGALAGQTANLTFGIGNAESLFAQSSLSVLPTLGGTNPEQQSFDFGLPFFYGKRVATVIEGATTTVGTGPYVAY